MKNKRHTAIVSSAEEYSDLKFAAFLKLVRLSIFKIKSELPAARFDVADLAFYAKNDIVNDMTIIKPSIYQAETSRGARNAVVFLRRENFFPGS